MTRVVVPLNPGVFSAFGLLLSNIEHEVTRALLRRLQDLDATELETIYRELEASVERVMTAEGHDLAAATISRSIDLRYTEQAHELTVPFQAELAELAQSFSDEHQRTYGHEAGAESVESVALRVTGQIPVEGIESYEMLAGLDRERAGSSEVAALQSRLAYFGPEAGQRDTPVITRRKLLGAPRAGPLIVEEYDATCVVPPGWQAEVDERGNIVLQFG